MGTLGELVRTARAGIDVWRHLRVADLRFIHWSTARLTLLTVVFLALALLLLRLLPLSGARRDRLALPALLRTRRRFSFAFVRHVPLVLFVAGLPFFAMALADPYTALKQEEVSFPGRRIGLMIDASSSMTAPFTAQHLNAHSPTQAAFFTGVSAAEEFVKLRMKGKYRDLMALVEFGNEAYVVTPFTNDYENILISLSLIGDVVEFTKFPDQGTTIGLAIQQSVELFRAFDFLNASGNLLVIISDGEDARAVINGKSVNDIVQEAVEAKIPVYFIRTAYERQLGGVIPDDLWKAAIEKTGGRFYAAANEATILHAIREIDQLGGGTIAMKRYTTQQPRFMPFAGVAVLLWAMALGLRLTVPYCQKGP